MSKYTPGPWTVGVYEVTKNMTERLKHKQIAVCSDFDKQDPKGLLIALCGDIDPQEKENTKQSYADAALIAAAPELLKALENLGMEVYSQGLEYKFQAQMDEAFAIIKKAKGGS